MRRMTVLEYLTEKGVICLGERICPFCGDRLDPEEKCECPEARDRRGEKENSTHDTLARSGAINK